MNIEDFGFKHYLEKTNQQLGSENIGRIIEEHRGSYLTLTDAGVKNSILRGKFMRETKDPSQFPKVGDFVITEKISGDDKLIVKEILPRYGVIARQETEPKPKEQVLAVNVDTVFVVFGVDSYLDIYKIAKFVALGTEVGAKVVIIFNKRDLLENEKELVDMAEKSFPNTTHVFISSKQEEDLKHLEPYIIPGETLMLLGVSGAGKSTLLNLLMGKFHAETGSVREDDGKGRHTTTSRELVRLPNGTLLIDTPGIRTLS